MLLVVTSVVIGIVIIRLIILDRSGGLEIVLILRIDVLVVVLLLLVLLLLFLLLLILLLLILFLLVLFSLAKLLLLLLLSIIIRHISTAAVIPRRIVIQFNAIGATIIPVRSTSIMSIATAIRRSRRIMRRSRRIMVGTRRIVSLIGHLIVRWVAVVWVIDLWRRCNMRVMVVMFIIKRFLNSMLLLVENVSHFVNQMLIRSDVQIDQGLKHLLAIVILGDLERDQRIHIDNAQVKAVGGNGAEIGILCRMGAVGIEWVAAGGIGQAEGDTEGRLYLLIA